MKSLLRSSPPKVLEEVLPLCAKNLPNQMQRDDRRAPTDDARSPGELEMDAASPSGPVRPSRPSRWASPACLRPGRRPRVGHGDVRAEPPRTPSAIAWATSADTAPCSSITPAGTPSWSTLTSFAYATIPPRKTSLDPESPSGARPRARPCTTRPSQGQTARPALVQNDLRDRPLVLGEQILGQLAAQHSRRAPRPSPTRSTWISKSRAQMVASTPLPSPPASASTRATADSLTP